MRKKRLPPLGALRAFNAVAVHRSFKLAADEIGVTATAISHQIRLLEEQLATKVCERSAKGVTLTPAGEMLFATTQRVFSALQDTVEKIHAVNAPPVLTITTTSNFLTHWLVPRLTDLKAALPAIDLRLHTSVERVDLTRKTVDAAIRYREEREETLTSTLLYQDRFVLVASPRLAIKQLRDLSSATLFHVDNRHIPALSPSWENWRRRFGPADLNIDAGLHFTDETHAIQAVVAGQGIAIVSSLLAHDFIRQGVLSAPFEHALPGANYYLVTLPDYAGRDDIAHLRSWLLAQMQKVA
ncbi:MULTISPECIES: LysR substrate-binding domain-containing protein [unclassified Brenneria]|uniref:LysR substrate-binding domain-containing protein n=1 Tax=unclassified Brenneria TaxID=2634434 RepID=UPI0029C2B94F|nr:MULTISPECIES: LysR substrate-binding domain-containing protein [unclassified Brenneria]MDX5629639.1 LysR substrate-binding domain-containing protein [Brenneria sp. L3-3Z]MDX5696785.1 LysR substrate-binding domain-containing protein [Brenneria sp. L4-2C]